MIMGRFHIVMPGTRSNREDGPRIRDAGRLNIFAEKIARCRAGDSARLCAMSA